MAQLVEVVGRRHSRAVTKNAIWRQIVVKDQHSNDTERIRDQIERMIGRESRLDSAYIGAASGDAVNDNAHAQSGTGVRVSARCHSQSWYKTLIRLEPPRFTSAR